ncbi:MAG: EAL domain-containing protein, partial [Acidimicrobiia bacterium]|nr:EAL domain-containing protein [Acidimicrobiia bacterium]
YEAKRGRLPIEVAPTGETHGPATGACDSLLEEPKGPHQVEMRYEPVIDLRTGELRALRAGMLWNLAGPIDREPPGGHSLVDGLGCSVLERSLADLDRLCRDGLNPGVKMLVHLNAQDILDARLNEAARQAVERVDVDPARLIIGVEEQLLRLVDPMSGGGFGATGCTFAVEAFGVTSTSVLRMGELPAEYLIIDECFVDMLGSRSGGARIVAAIVELADVHAMKTIAARVTREADLATLRDLGCWAAYGPGVGAAAASNEVPAQIAVRPSR